MSRTIQHFSPERFTAVRESSGFTVTRLAQESMVNRQTIHTWEKGTRRPTVELLSMVMAVMGRPVIEVLDLSMEEATLHDLRVISGLSRAEVYAELGLSKSGWAMIERGEVVLTGDKVEPLAELFGLTVTIVNRAAKNTVKQWLDGHTLG